MNDYVNRSCDASSRLCCPFLAGAVDWRNARVSAPSYRRVSARWIILADCAPRPGEVSDREVAVSFPAAPIDCAPAASPALPLNGSMSRRRLDQGFAYHSCGPSRPSPIPGVDPAVRESHGPAGYA
jgi:hypothetical protein